VATAGDYCYVSLGNSGIRIVNTTNPAHSQELGYCDTPGSALELAVADSFVYVADGSFGLRIINVADPTNPHEVGFYDTPGIANCVAISGNFAYVADGSSGLHAINVSNPSNPQFVGTYFVQGAFARDVAISGNYAYVIYGGLSIIDVANPAQMVLISIPNTMSNPSNVEVSGNYAYVTGQSGVFTLIGYLQVIDVTNPANPQIRGDYREAGSGQGGLRSRGSAIFCFTVSDNYAYISSYYGWSDEQFPHPTFHSEYYQRILDVANPDSFGYIRVVNMVRMILPETITPISPFPIVSITPHAASRVCYIVVCRTCRSLLDGV
ncbi:MAG: hypothetical protein OEM52_03295, partial [bacterium]|nr:hypothetical protein [bacterium]